MLPFQERGSLEPGIGLEIHRTGPRSPTSNQAEDTLYPLPHAIHLRAPALSDLTPIAQLQRCSQLFRRRL